jgi:hypothetical protein
MMPEQLLTELRKLKESGVGDAELWAVAFQAGEAKALQEAFLVTVQPQDKEPSPFGQMMRDILGGTDVETPRTESEQAALDANEYTIMKKVRDEAVSD